MTTRLLGPARPAARTGVAAATAAVAAAALAFASLTWAPGLHLRRGGTSDADGRAQVTAQAARQLTVLTSADPADAAGTWRRWLDSSTGTLHDQLARDQKAGIAKLAAGRLTATGHVTSVGVTDYHGTVSDAAVIAAVIVHLAPSAPDEARRYQATLHHTAHGWKLSSLTAFSPPTPGTGAP
ncbi:hypothetical protein [Actinomadura verrucosospora]|uniref:Secreted protein n=1 Tax=Actinomadura verrucosospora TaxID=46165 RepID=A0A7D4ACD7_ACTVE|nr:hypothetical protein [Actinomadura verrucosospora]QKG27087.1 Secreted protein [Actinomadura verrucosospora]